MDGATSSTFYSTNSSRQLEDTFGENSTFSTIEHSQGSGHPPPPSSSFAIATFSIHRAISSLSSVLYIAEEEPPRLVLKGGKINFLNHRLEHSPEVIADKLAKEFNCAQHQMEIESDKSFDYNCWIDSNYFPKELHFEDSNNYRDVISRDLGMCSTIGRRSSMEDEHLVSALSLQLNNGEEPRAELFGVFDGHGGKAAAVFVKKHLTKQLIIQLQQHNPDELTDVGIWNALKMTLVSLHEMFPKDSSGTTVTFAMILNDKLWVANTGDARTVLNNGGEPIQLSEDAKPDDEKYEKGINKRGGEVLDVSCIARINGRLAVARAIGDHNCPGVNPRPKITAYRLSDIRPGSHLILACDGIWDVASTKQVVEAVHADSNASPLDLAYNIIAAAYIAGSEDNLTTLVVKLP